MTHSEISDTVIQYLLKVLEPYAIILFGSVVSGSLREDSDLDIAFMSEKEVCGYDSFIIAQNLAEKLGRDVDLIDLNKASTVFKAQIIGKGKTIYSGNDSKLAEFQIRALKEYALLNEERASVMRASGYMADDVILNKVAIIERCLQRINEEYEGNPANLKNLTKQDSIILNIQRACEAGIDLAMYIVAEKGLGIPQKSRDAFDLLGSHSILDDHLAEGLKAMVGFRNIAVHNYQELDLTVIERIIKSNLQDLVQFGQVMLRI